MEGGTPKHFNNLMDTRSFSPQLVTFFSLYAPAGCPVLMAAVKCASPSKDALDPPACALCQAAAPAHGHDEYLTAGTLRLIRVAA